MPIQDLPPTHRVMSTDHTRSIPGDDLVHEHGNEREQERKRLLAGRDRARRAVVQRADRDGGRGGSRERELLVDDVVLAERDDEEHAEEPSADRERDKLSDVLLRERRQEVQTIHRRDRRDEEDANTTCRRRGGLDGTVLLGTERTTQEPSDKARLR